MAEHQGKILFIVPYPFAAAPSQRFRYEQYLHILKDNGYSYEISPFYDQKTWKVLYQKGNLINKSAGLFKGFLKRWALLFKIHRFDQIFIHRESSPAGPSVIPWLIRFVFHKRLIFDFDDAIWLPNSSKSNRSFRFLKMPGNALKLMKWSNVNACGNEFLRQKALQYNQNAVLIPTTIDTERSHDRETDHPLQGKLIIGWTGSHSTVDYLHQILPVIQELEKDYDFEFRVISDREPPFKIASLNYIKWKKESEIEDLEAINIGLMPLPDDQWAEGKCGLKALQYMALGIPVLLTPLGVNREIIIDGVHGYFCISSDDWKKRLISLLEDRLLLRKLGSVTRQRIESAYSVNANASKFLLLFTLKR